MSLFLGQEDEIRLISVHWSDPERDEYLYTSRLYTLEGREIKSWKVEPTNDILSKSRYRVEFVHSSKEEETEEEKLVGRRELVAPRPGFEPGSKPRQGFMIGHYTIGAGIGTTTVVYFNRSRGAGVDIFTNWH